MFPDKFDAESSTDQETKGCISCYLFEHEEFKARQFRQL